MKISTRLILFISVMLIVVITANSTAYYFLGKEAIKEKSEAHLKSVIILKENQLQSFIEEEKKELESIAKRHLIISRLENNEKTENQTENEQAWETISVDAKNLIEVFILDLEGNIYFSTNKNQEGKIKTNEEYFIRGKKGTFVKSFYYSLNLQQPSIVITTPIKNEQGQLLGVLAGRVNLERISKIMAERSGLGQTGETYLVNQINLVVTKSRFIENIKFKKTIQTEGVKKCLGKKEGVSFYNDYRKIPVVGYYKWIPELEVCLLAEIDQQEEFASLYRLLKIILFMGITLIILSTISASSFSIAISKSIEKLTESVDKITKGNFKVKLKKSKIKEIQKLTDSLNKILVSMKLAILRTGSSKEELGIGTKKALEAKKEAEEKLRYFQKAVEASADAIGMSTPKGKHYYQNKAFDELFGEIGDNPPARIYVDKKVGEKVFKTIKAGKEWEGEVKMYGKDKKELTILLSAYAIKDKKGKILGLVGVHTDITEKKKKEKKLKEVEEKYKTLFKNASEAIFIADTRTKKIVDCNKEAEKLLGYPKKKILSMKAAQLHPKDRVKETMEGFKKQSQGRIKMVESEIITKNKKRIPVSISTAPVQIGGRKFMLGIFRVTRDVKR